MIPKVLEDALNDQIKSELDSAYLYFSMSAYFESESLPGFAHWMRHQAREEFGHVMKYYDFLNDRSGRVRLQALGEPASEFQSPRDVFEKTLALEQEISAEINQLYELSKKENDNPTQVFLHWFIDEQVEEEKSIKQILEMLKRVGDAGPALVALDQQLGQRGS